MADPYEEDLFEQTGPYEPITTRIRNILREYKDGVGIFKELIQNADDAGATTVKFLVDWRQGQTNTLFSPGMAECQGPALWAYNDAVFTDEDFENINKLAGETKVEDLSKIGRFGLGFNAVYHVTDVPSFISREYLVIFDPNAHHLQHHIKDRSRPGIRTNLCKKPESFTRFHDQLQPYNSVFGCSNGQTRGGFKYNGTLFRFPFRTANQARASDISKAAYGRDKIQAIVCSLCECASTLLIFSQHVKKVEVYELDAFRQPSQMQLLMSVKKRSAQPFGLFEVNRNDPFIKQCSKWWEQHRNLKKACTEYPSGCERLNITTTKEPSELSGCKRKHSSNEMWLVVSASGTNTSLTIASSPEGRSHGLLPCGGAAFAIQRDSGQGFWKSYVASNPSGELFCFLPLTISTGLPVHVNGYFAIMSNRVEIWKRTSMRSQPIEVTWNEALMEDALARAYIMLLENMKALSREFQHYEFHTLWPACENVDMKSWEKLVQKICSVLLEQQSKLFYSDGSWMSINEGFLLSDDFDDIHDTAAEVLKSLGKHVFNLPRKILKTLAMFDQTRILEQRTLTFTTFLQQHFFRNIKKLPPTQRDAIVCFGLDRILKRDQAYLFAYTPENNLFQQYPCIAVSQNGKLLKRPCELIHPSGLAAPLFSEDDHRFPLGHGLRDGNRLYVLETLGMERDLDWGGILERAQSIADLHYNARTEGSRKFVKYLNKRVDQLPNNDRYGSLLQDIKFIPVLKEPVNEYILPWKGSSCLLTTFCAPKEVFLPRNAKLVGSSCYIVNTSVQSGCGKFNADVQDLLGFSNRLPEDRFVIQQMDEAIKFWRNLSDGEKQDTTKSFAIESICKKIYEFFNYRIANGLRNRGFMNELGERNWLFIEGEFVESKKVAYTSKGNGAPYLFTLPSNYIRDYRHLLEVMRIKQAFDEENYIGALYEMQSIKQGRALTEDELQITIFFISQIDVENPSGQIDVEDYIGEIPLPDIDRILHRSKDLVVNLNLWLQDPDDNLKVHGKIPPETAYNLGAKLLKNVILSGCSQSIGYGESFGQHEDLTDRLKGILEGYPADGILKELVQNADDAEASQIHFIHDTRSLPFEKVVTKDDTSEEIQGPALCVYNDKPFTDRDFEGLKHLGIGSKRDSPGMTGRYGIGFNSVYHLTDCPSFLSDDDKLVFLDPHCRYLPGADSGNPGRLFKVNRIRNEFPDTLNGYLAGHFNLQSSTMFRFPLRRKRSESKISNESVDIEELFKTFQQEARNSLLFLNHIKKITFSKIKSNNNCEEIYQVEAVISPNDEKKRQDMARKICNLNCTPTAEIGWEGVSYILIIKENRKEVEKWLIQQCIGSISPTLTINNQSGVAQNEIPDGRKLGLLPRGGLAARLWTNSSSPEKQLKGIVCCFLPLPANESNLPVHINGHFALDNSRRDLYTDPDGKEQKSKWNHFVKSCVLPPAYAALITDAQNHLFKDPANNQLSRYHELFPKVSKDSPWKTLTIGLYRFLGLTRAKVLPLLMPTKSEEEGKASTRKEFSGNEMDDHENTVTSLTQNEFPRNEMVDREDTMTTLTQKEFPGNEVHDLENTVTNTVRNEFSEKNTDDRKDKVTISIRKENSRKKMDDVKLPAHVTCTTWLSAEQAYFISSGIATEDFYHFLLLLMRIGLPVLLYAPFRIHRGFQSAHTTSYEVTPKSVISFLRDFKCSGSACKIDQLPKILEKSVIKSVPELSALMRYCCKDEEFGKNLEGLPLLLTHDGYLRVFDSRQPVFRSEFGDLFPTKLSLFVHSEIVHLIPWIATESEEKIVHDFTVNDLAGLLSHVFTKQTLRDIKDRETWNFPSEGVLSEKWFKQFWDFLQNYTKLRTGESFVALECLSEWPVIPTTCGKLVKIKNGKTVLDMTASGTESTEQENVRIFLTNLKCPVLNKEVTFKDEHSSSSNDSNSADEDQTKSKPEVYERKPAVTDFYVAHPHNVIDVLDVLNHMLNANRLDPSETDEEKVLNFLKFVQDNYRGLELLDDHKQILKRLPFHKALDGRFVSLTGQFSSYALVPSGLPKEQLDELQNRARCLFLDSDALHNLKKLYSDLDVRGGHNITQFYVEYVFQYFSMFTRETQMQHLLYIGNEVHPHFPQRYSTAEERFLNEMSTIPCIPDENGYLHSANEFFDPQNKIFQLMFEDKDGKFPPSPFNEEDWHDLLKDIGLQVDITPQLFLQFCREVAEDGQCSPGDHRIHKRSKELVKCLFSEKDLRGDKFLFELSKIKFIAPAKMDEQITCIHKQYQCLDNGYPPFIEFRKSVPWYYREMSWTTASILPTWAQPNDMNEFKSLGIACNGPAYPDVMNHLLNVASVCNPASVDTGLLHEITKIIYKYLLKLTHCFGPEPTETCSEVCKDIGILLKDVPCIFLQEDEVFVKAERLVFKLGDDCLLKPFLYPVPLEFGELQHILKRLGTTEKPSPSQIAYVFNEMRRDLGEDELSPEDEKKARYAVYYLFNSLYHGETADAIEELYLPSQSKRLVKSCDLVCKVSPRFTEIVERLQRPILLSLKECNLKKVDDDYIDKLPEHLRPGKFEDIVREDIDPECKVSICSQAQEGSICNFQARFENLLRSYEFQEGLKRLLVHAGQNPEKFEHTLKKLLMQTDVQTKCVGLNSVKISVIDRDTDEVLDNLEDSSYAVRDKDTWFLYLQHEFKGDRSLDSIASCVNKVLGECIREELMLSAMLGCSSPSEIAKKLNKRSITQSTSKSDDEDPEWDSDDMEFEEGDSPGGYGGHRSRCGGKGRSSVARGEDDIFYPASREEAIRWVKQSKSDLNGARWLLHDSDPRTSADPPFNALACFQSHQVVEKCLKAVLFAKCGMCGETLKSHKVERLIDRLIEDVREIPEGLIQRATKVSHYYLSTRYPNRQRNRVPAEAYSKNEAEQAVKAASRVLEIVEDHLGQ